MPAAFSRRRWTGSRSPKRWRRAWAASAVSRVKIFFDGGCRPNPGAIEIAVVAAGRTTILRDLGHGTSSDAEWLALIHALTIAQSLGTSDFVLLGDSADVVAKANGTLT